MDMPEIEQSRGGLELEPWLIVSGQGADATLALWQIEAKGTQALALFSNESKAANYAERILSQQANAQQFPKLALVQVFMDCYQQGIMYAVLDPEENEAGQIFSLKEVLGAARSQLKSDANAS